MYQAYLFDWGDTLMVNFPDEIGPMCDWPTVKIVDGAKATLQALSQHARIYIATSAASSSELQVRSAFRRVGLEPFITGYFCQENIGLAKGDPDFIKTILSKIDLQPQQVAMVGDSVKKDIQPAIEAGIDAFWLNSIGTDNTHSATHKVTVIKSLNELLS